MRQTERQQFTFEGDIGGRLLAPDAEAALPVQHFAAFKGSFGSGDDTGTEAGRGPRGLVAERRACNRYAELQSDHMDWPVQRRVFAGLVRQHCVFLEAAARMLGVALEYHIGAEREVAGNVAAVP